MVKAGRYANYLQREKARQSGIDVEVLRGYIKRHLAELENTNFENITTTETMEEDKQAYETVVVAF